MFHYSLRVIHEPKMSEIRILNLCHKKMILVDIYRQSLLTVKIRRRIFLDFQLTLSYMSKKKERKRKENDPALFFRDSLPETKTELSFKSFTTGFLFLPFVLLYFCFWNPNSGLQARCETCFSLVYQTC